MLHPAMRPALIELHRAKLRATVHPADGGGLQFHIPGPDDTFVLIGSPEVLPGPDEAPAGFGAELYTPDGEHLDVLFHACTDPTCCAPAAGADPLNARTMARAIATALHAHATTLPAVVPTTGQILHRIAELIDADTDRTTALYTHPLGVPGCVLDHLTQQAVYGTDPLWFGHRYAALGRDHSTDAVTTWTAGLDAALHTARDLLRPLAAMARPLRTQSSRPAPGLTGRLPFLQCALHSPYGRDLPRPYGLSAPPTGRLTTPSQLRPTTGRARSQRRGPRSQLHLNETDLNPCSSRCCFNSRCPKSCLSQSTRSQHPTTASVPSPTPPERASSG
ncbi:hypothetical protein PUR61_38630 [Streptomyces sp. BE20]|uniref:hypothetical protein n=1 Tax=Streptomyces sp. BE20 TaxID=3002525 RepID=UPI002E75D81A|nr:hypothetical protein [Streptomyces sp. BE20]MEE1828053.1 hypothetical protein [Streptomyces sp. BE20]